jgi:hypothetical protein
MKFAKTKVVGKFVSAAVFLSLAVITLCAHPSSITCTIDHQPMQFDHQDGTGTGSVCWYSHTVPNGMGTVKHEASIDCDTGVRRP